MSTRSVSPPEPATPVGPVVVEPPQPRGGALRRSRRRLIAALVAPAVLFMTLVHLLPTLGGFYLSFKNLNLFTFNQLFDAPWAGVENYRSVLFDSDNPLHDGFVGAVRNTAIYTFWTVLGTLGGGLAVALLLNRPMRGVKVDPRADADALDRAQLRRACCGSSCGRATSGSSTRSSSTTPAFSASGPSG